ncbi:unnamed protein product [Urochloa humidicola]
MDFDIQRVLDELKTVASSVADLKSSLTKRMEGMEKSLGDRFTALKTAAKQIDVWKPEIDTDALACVVPAPENRITFIDPDAPACITPVPTCITPAPTVSAIDAGVKLVQCCSIDTTTMFLPTTSPKHCHAEAHLCCACFHPQPLARKVFDASPQERPRTTCLVRFM